MLCWWWVSSSSFYYSKIREADFLPNTNVGASFLEERYRQGCRHGRVDRQSSRLPREESQKQCTCPRLNTQHSSSQAFQSLDRSLQPPPCRKSYLFPLSSLLSPCYLCTSSFDDLKTTIHERCQLAKSLSHVYTLAFAPFPQASSRTTLSSPLHSSSRSRSRSLHHFRFFLGFFTGVSVLKFLFIFIFFVQQGTLFFSTCIHHSFTLFLLGVGLEYTSIHMVNLFDAALAWVVFRLRRFSCFHLFSIEMPSSPHPVTNWRSWRYLS